MLDVVCGTVPGIHHAQPVVNPVQAVKPAIPTVAGVFDLRDVRLLDGPFKRAMELNQQNLLFLQPDRLLSGVRQNAGLTPKAPRYGGWEVQGVAGQTLGHYMTALAQQFRATGDVRFRERVDYIVDELAAEENLKEFKRRVRKTPALPISAAFDQGVDKFKQTIREAVEEAPPK